MYRRLLIPVSTPSEVEPLLRFGAGLLDADGEIRILHIIRSHSLPEVIRDWRSSVNFVIPAHEAAAALDVQADPEIRASTDVAGEILDSAETREVDAILMTLRGDRRERNPFVGHTASAILHHAACDVVIVNRLALTGERINRVLVPAFHERPPPKVMRLAEEIAVHHQGIPIVTLGLSGVVPELTGEAGVETLPRSPRGLPLLHRRATLDRGFLGRRHRLPEVILAEASRERYGLLIVGEDPASTTGTLLTRRFLDELFRRAPCPVVAIRG
ncbi:MAG: universal stress protein [Thermoplasmata archaeon]|nr:universal stress protein [Thermoplasmata archaeon]MCI4341405.1 universal stress protein [Thermoplasmata archaeon]